MSLRSKPLILFSLIAFIISIFFLFFINLSTDTIILFVSQKIYLGKWLAKGIMPFYNPQLYGGIPFLFDPGMGHLHPFNIFFLLPYPLSFSLWTGLTTFTFLIGFYLLFRSFSKSDFVSILLTLVIFFSGSGFWRTNNPAISLVIAHYGLFFYSMKKLQEKNISLLMLISGIFMTLSGHIQFVLYGYIIGFLVARLFYKVPLKKILINFVLLGILTSWFYLLCLPIVFTSTRLTTHKDYTNMGPLHPLQVIQLVFPLFFGYVLNGSKWNAGPTFVILISSLFIPALTYLSLRQKISKSIALVLVVFIAATLGVINFPFFRGAAQSFIVVHILGLILVAQNFETLIKCLQNVQKRIYLIGLIGCSVAFMFFLGSFFTDLFLLLYSTVKKSPSLFYDQQTVNAIGKIIGLNFIPLMVLFALLLIGREKKKMLPYFILFFLIFEGIFLNYFHNYFVPSRIISKKTQLPKTIDEKYYRIQTGADVIPYFGFHNYISEVLFRPPFSKEPTSFDVKEQKTLEKLGGIFSFYPSTWAMTAELSTLQGYNTFVTKKIAEYFKEPSSDYRQVYDYIIARNSLYGQSEIGLDINGIETSKITFNDPRWQELGVRYFISDRPLPKYDLIEKDGNRYFYENKNTLPIYRLVDSSGNVGKAPLNYKDPNKMVFNLKQEDVGRQLVIVINPDGFIAKHNGKQIPIRKDGFQLIVPVSEKGEITVSYSPVFHLQETIAGLQRDN